MAICALLMAKGYICPPWWLRFLHLFLLKSFSTWYQSEVRPSVLSFHCSPAGALLVVNLSSRSTSLPLQGQAYVLGEPCSSATLATITPWPGLSVFDRPCKVLCISFCITCISVLLFKGKQTLLSQVPGYNLLKKISHTPSKLTLSARSEVRR